jgi:hypothetical protein
MRVKALDADPGRTYIDRLEVQGSNHRVVLTLDGVQLDGKPLDLAEHPHVADDLLVHHRVGVGGETRVDLVLDPFKLALMVDDGTDPELHGGKELEGIPHLAMFVDSAPVDLDGVKGILVDATEGCEVEPFMPPHKEAQSNVKDIS